MTTIYLLRHSKSIKSDDLIFDDKLDEQTKNERTPLSPIGEEEAKRFSNNEELTNIDVIFSSEYERAKSTAKYIATNNNLKLIISKDINERKIGDAKDYPKTFWLTQFEDENAKAPNGESRKEVTERFTRFINRVLVEYKDKRIVLVSHGTAITFLLMNWCKLVDVQLENKVRHLTFKGKDVINDTIKNLDLFKLTFDGNNIVDVELVK
ncbi:MAG: histidine phosphatase family protein [Firmicutes bacterium]|nr:histidine phosphatase family protein [Bacillota bacterium]